ncbi:MAG: Rieske 2Fe-2S domain-containing protein [Acetobacteraceae bacterium]
MRGSPEGLAQSHATSSPRLAKLGRADASSSAWPVVRSASSTWRRILRATEPLPTHQGAASASGRGWGSWSREPGQYDYSQPGELLCCPWHGWEFDIRTGQSWCDPERTRAKSYPVAVAAGSALVKGLYQAETFHVGTELDYIGAGL